MPDTVLCVKDTKIEKKKVSGGYKDYTLQPSPQKKQNQKQTHQKVTTLMFLRVGEITQ